MYMKNLFKLALASIVLSFSLIACENAEDGLVLPLMTAKIDGVEWKAALPAAASTKTPDTTTVITGAPSITSLDKQIALTFFGNQVGTYKLSAGTLKAECALVYKKTASATEDGNDYYVAGIAEVIVSKYDSEKKLVSGTFSATLFLNGNPLSDNQIKVTEGTFTNVKLIINN